MTKLKTADEITRTIQYEMQINSLWKEDRVGFSGFTSDGLLTVAGLIKKDRLAISTALVEALESEATINGMLLKERVVNIIRTLLESKN